MKRISLEELVRMEQGGDCAYEEQCRLVVDLLDSGRLRPLKASGLNGKKPALYREYWLLEEEKDYSGLRDELRYHLSPLIRVDYYLNHLKEYEKDRTWVLRMSDYLSHRRELLEEAESLNERCFEIWGREKFLRDQRGGRILRRMGLSLDDLNLYETAEPLAYYSHTKRTPQDILILENKDTFYTMRRHLQGGGRILDAGVGTLIYGAGKGILRSFHDLSLCMEPYMNEESNRFWYFGDLDYEGIAIYESLCRLLEGSHPLQPLTRAYQRMLEKAPDPDWLPEMKEGQTQRGGERFFSYFPESDTARMREILRRGKYIPQEIVTQRDL